MAFIDWFVEPFRFPFMVRGMIAATSVGGLCAVVGAFVVLRGMAFMGDAIAHSILPGLAGGVLTTGRGDRQALFGWALGTALLVALGMGWISERGRIREDTAIGIVFAGMFALGIALISTLRGFAVDLVHFLFGNVLGVSSADLVLIGGFGGGVLFAVLLFYKELVVVSFDPILAKTLRLPTAVYRYLLFGLIAITVVVSLQTVGVALMLAMLIVPASTAFLLARRLPSMIAVGAAFGMLSGAVGLYLSFYWSIASGAAIVLVAIGFFLAVLIGSPHQGLLAQWLRRRQPSH